MTTGCFLMPVGLLITKDVFFASKVTGTASALGLSMRMVMSLEQLKSLLGDDTRLVILDLDCTGITPPDVTAALPPNPDVTTVAFGPHVHEAKLEAARNAGFQHVMPRSRFSADLVQILKAAASI